MNFQSEHYLSEFIEDDEDISHSLFTDDYNLIKVGILFVSFGVDIFKETFVKFN